MGGKSAPVPDYKGAAEASSASSNEQLRQQTFANRMTQVNPWGKLSYTPQNTVDPSSGKNTTTWTQTQTLTPAAQAALDSQMRITQGRSDLAEDMLPRVAGELGQDMDWSQFAKLQTNVPQGQQMKATTSAGGAPLAYQNIDTSRAATPALQQQYDFGKLQNVDNADATRSQMYDVMMKQAGSRLDPQWQQQQTALQTQLAQKGITEGSAAYQSAMDQFGRSKTDAYNQAMMSASTGAGDQAAQMHGMNLGLRAQQMQEAMGQGNFRNQALQSQFGMGLQGQQAQLAAQQAAFNQSLQGGQYGLQRENQSFNQGMGAAQQNYNMNMSSANYQNQLRAAQIAESQQKRQWTLNELQALLSGQQVGQTNFQGFNAAGMGAGTDYTGAMKNTYDAQQNSANAQNAMGASLMQGAGSMAMAFSDRRVKADVRTVGRDPRGWRIVSFRYIGERGRRVGVIAQEVRRLRPDAVVAANDVLMVNYPLLYGA
jgi:hypothetical protein